jgi:uncharacterized protein YlxW (UPF0749 family)
MAGLPTISFKDFVKNPIVALLFMSLMAIGYLYYDNKSTLTSQVKDLQEEVRSLQRDYKQLNDKFIDTLEKIHKK